MINLKLAEQHKKVLELLQPSDPDFYTEAEEAAKNRYPGVPYPYCLTWERSDEEANTNPEFISE